MTQQMDPDDIERLIVETARRARQASRSLAVIGSAVKDRALLSMADGLEEEAADILSANQKDVAEAKEGDRNSAFIDRMTLTPDRIRKMATALREVSRLQDPVGSIDSAQIRPNGLQVSRVRTPIGVVAIIHESRPDVTSDAAALCLKSGNACILRGGSDAARSSGAIAGVMVKRGIDAGLPRSFMQIVPVQERSTLPILLRQDDMIDVVVPRGGEGLIRMVVEQSTIPVVKHYKGVCHTYVHADADLDMAVDIAENAKCQRPGTCNALETLLVHREASSSFLPRIAERYEAQEVVIHGCPETCRLIPWARLATDSSWDTEYLDLEVSVRVVDDLDQALDHIAAHGTGHSEAIITEGYAAAERFLAAVDAAAVFVNASTRFTDGSQFGLGAEIGISTQKLHARGPMGLQELTTYKYVVRGTGQVRQ